VKKLDAKVILFNAAAVLITVAALAGVLRSLVFSPTAAPCSDRYTSSTVFALERAGVVLAAADLQSSVGGKDAGVLDNVAIARLKDGPAPIAMAVSLPKGSTSPFASAPPKGGMSFPWQPRPVQGKTAACLSYNVFLPADFQFNRGGVLPGISGADAAAPSPDGFTARMVWRRGEAGGATLRVMSGGETRSTPVDRESFAFPRGRWVKLEQEVVLNTPKQADGVLRVWVDGRLAVERTDLNYRAKPGVTVSGVAADVFYGTEDGAGAAPKDTKVSLTPFEIRWQ
jgi:hypothetical protein